MGCCSNQLFIYSLSITYAAGKAGIVPDVELMFQKCSFRFHSARSAAQTPASAHVDHMLIQ